MHQTGSHLRIDPPFLVAELVKSFGLLEQPEVTERLKKKLPTLYQDIMADAPAWEPLAN